MPTAPKIAIVGGGLSGLSTAYFIRKLLPDADVRVFESSPHAGGLVGTLRHDGFLVELGPNGFLDSRTEIVDLCVELGLGDQLERANATTANRFVLQDGKLRRLPSTPKEFFKSDLLSWKGKLAFLSERFFGRAGKLTDETIAEFGRRHFGAEATDVFLDAMVTGIFAGDYEKLSMPACLPRFAELEREYGSLLKAQGAMAKRRKSEGKAGAFGGVLTAPRGGMGVLIDTLANRLADCVQCGHEATGVRKENNQWRIDFAKHPSEYCDILVFACPSWQQAVLLNHEVGNEESRELSGLLAEIPFAPAVVVAVGFKKSDLPPFQPGFGYLAPERLGRPVLGVIYSSCVFDNQSPDDALLFRAILGGDRRSDVITWSDNQLLAAVSEDLSSLLDIKAEPVFHVIKRWPKAIPQYHVGHLERVRRIESNARSLGGLYLTGYSFHGVGVADCVREGKATAELIQSACVKAL